MTIGRKSARHSGDEAVWLLYHDDMIILQPDSLICYCAFFHNYCALISQLLRIGFTTIVHWFHYYSALISQLLRILEYQFRLAEGEIALSNEDFLVHLVYKLALLKVLQEGNLTAIEALFEQFGVVTFREMLLVTQVSVL